MKPQLKPTQFYSTSRLIVMAGTRKIHVMVRRVEEKCTIGDSSDLERTADKVSELLDGTTTANDAIVCVHKCFSALDRVAEIEIAPAGMNASFFYRV